MREGLDPQQARQLDDAIRNVGLAVMLADMQNPEPDTAAWDGGCARS